MSDPQPLELWCSRRGRRVYIDGVAPEFVRLPSGETCQPGPGSDMEPTVLVPRGDGFGVKLAVQPSGFLSSTEIECPTAVNLAGAWMANVSGCDYWDFEGFAADPEDEACAFVRELTKAVAQYNSRVDPESLERTCQPPPTDSRWFALHN
ncbi:hypothetical protein [Alienimonas sp. DA493]|uniref:hypothetical protein n=1 Tax=Alienimonas sp. DA493 TaxID=3373605 RepID=UPI00375418FE